jgi:subtilisin family serine protease
MLLLAGCAAGPTRPEPDSIEYRLSWGLQAVNADPAYLAGASGRGVTIALIDCGVEQPAPELARQLSRRSTDLNPERMLPQPDRHGAFVAGPMESALDGRGLVGVAYNATLLSVRADFDGGWEGQCAFYPRDIARGIDYARENGARIIVMPLQARRPLGQKFEAALERAVQSGIAIVIAAGNGANEQPSWPARYAVDPRFAGHIVVVGASRFDGTFATWSNRAGPAAPYYITAPGENVVTDCGRRECKLVSGTSFSAPYVAGALALIMDARPAFTSRDAIAVLLRSARPIAAPEDPAERHVGQGALDIGRAFSELERTAVPAAAVVSPDV